MRSAELLDRLQRHYIKPGPFPGGVFVRECGINGGVQARVDALYVGFTSTSGRLLVGHEVKVSRADWRRELDKAGKADRWADACHQWIIVAPGPDVVPREEVPHGWGLMYPSPRTKVRMHTVIRPTTHVDRVPSWDIVRSIMARLDTLQTQERADYRRKADEAARAEAEAAAARRAEVEGQRVIDPATRRRLAALTRLERDLGASITDGWNPGPDKVLPEVAAGAMRLARALVAGGVNMRQDRYATDQLRSVAQQLLDSLDAFSAARDDLNTLLGTPDPDR